MSLKRTTFKQRIRKNDLKQRNAVSSGIRKRMRAGRRVSNKFDQIDNGSRPMEAMMMEIQDGCAVPTQESSLDPRALTDLLLSSAADVEPVVKPAKPTASTTDKETPATMILPLAAAMNTVSARLEMLNAAAEEDAERRRAVLASQTQTTNKNQYRHHGQPYLFWQRIGVHPLLLLALRDMKFSHPTPVQEEVLPNVISVKDGSSTEAKSKKRKASKTGTDVIVSAETGSGKTLVFALPILNRVLADCFPSAGAKDGASTSSSSSSLTPATTKKTKGEKRSRASEEDANQENKDLPAQDEDYMRRLMHSLIISPTRELALQINDAMTQLTKHAPQIRIGCVVGGMAQEKQQRILNRHPHILICTPGRLWELVQKNEGCYLGHSMSRRLRYIVLDEADKMLQSGRFEELKNLLERIHCETLPAGFAQDREEGAEIEEVKVQEGRWDAVKQCFVPFSKEEGAPKKKEPTPVKKSSSKKASRETEVKKSKGKKRRQEEEEEEEEEEGDEEDELKATSAGPRSKKDQPRTIPMPPEPAADHRVVTFVTSATLSLQTNYERRDYKSNKSIIRTSNADVMNKVLQQLEIKPTNAQIFTLSPTADVAAKINETYLRCPDDSKDLYLYYFLKTYSQDRAVIFVNAISMLRRLVKLLEILGLPVVGLHASMQQRQRLKYIEKFKRGELRVLVATDVASRGLDIEGLKYVVHYQVPRTTDAYIHRCGRTARCGGTGLSLLLVNATEYVSFNKLMESLGRKEREMETFALQPSVVHQLHQPLRMALQIDKLQKEVDKSRAKNTWVSRMSRDAELDVDDMFDDEADGENRSKLKAIRALKKELDHLSKKFTGSFGGKGAFRTGASALGAKEAERKFQERADRQTIKVAKLTKARR